MSNEMRCSSSILTLLRPCSLCWLGGEDQEHKIQTQTQTQIHKHTRTTNRQTTTTTRCIYVSKQHSNIYICICEYTRPPTPPEITYAM
jgi:hypothetical protein